MSYKYTMFLLRIIFIVVLIWLSFFGPYKAFLNSNPISDKKYLDVYEGSSMYAVLNNLKLNSSINKLFFKIYLNINSIESFQAGEYAIENKNFIEIIDLLAQGETFTHSFTIIEGMNIYDLESKINKSYLINDCSFLACIKSDYPFKEGVLYPDTYYYKKGMKASEILNISHKKLDDILNTIWIKKPKNDILKNKYQALVLASIIEKEAGNHEEKTDIASVFLKRLSIGMRLQADPTIIYGLLPNFSGDIRKSDILDKNNIYNTYMIKGLPPAPISISSMSSIEAAIMSLPGEYLYFVANSPNSHYFSRTYDEHLNMIKKVGLDK
ncbi:endolytic transglycosylase MltG [Gammaproteobacteria bacterium]|nr:endolytic transglycosylase MltG [Gammaproteobacteria bacterium]